RTPCATKGPQPAPFDASGCIPSSTATGGAVQDSLERGLAARGAVTAAAQGAPALGARRKTPLHVQYVATVPSYLTLLNAMRSFLTEAGGKSAPLRESGSA